MVDVVIDTATESLSLFFSCLVLPFIHEVSGREKTVVEKCWRDPLHKIIVFNNSDGIVG